MNPTNIIATISFIIATNWFTISVTTPRCDQPFCAVAHISTENQVGARVTNTVATFVWNGRTNQVTLESTQPFYNGDLTRSVPRNSAMPSNWYEFKP